MLTSTPPTDYGLRTTDYGLRTTDYGLRTTDYGLRTTDYGLRTTDYGGKGLVELFFLNYSYLRSYFYYYILTFTSYLYL